MLLTLNLNPTTRDDSVFVSASATSLESLLPVQLEDDDFKEYVNTFFPKRRPLKGFHTSRKHFYDLAVYLAQVSAFLGALQAHLKALALDVPVYDEHTLLKTAPSKFARLLIGASDEGVLAVRTKDYLESLRGKHVIVKSKAGFNLKFSGLPNGTCLTHPLATDLTFPDSKRSFGYEEFTKSGNLDKAAFKMVLAVAKSLVVELTKQESTVETSATRKTSMSPLEYDLGALLTRLNKVAQSIIPGVDLFGTVVPPVPASDLVLGLGKYVRILIVQEADKRSVDQLSRPTPPPLTEESSSLTPEGVVLNAFFGVSFAVVLPQRFAEFITQTSPGNEVPLVPLNTWVNIWTSAVMRQPKTKQKGDRVNIYQAPRYILSASQSATLGERRKALGFFTEPGRTNEDNIFTSNTGRFNWCPPAKDLVMDNAKGYEALMEEALRLSYEAGTPLAASQIGETSKVFGIASPSYKEKIRAIKARIASYAGSLQTYNWDYNVILTSSASDPEKLVAYNLAGAAQPNDLGVADYLRKPFSNAMNIMFPSTAMVDDGGARVGNGTSEESFGKGGSVTSMLKTTLFMGIFKLYQYLLAERKVPLLQDLVLEAAKALGIKELTAEDTPYDMQLYTSVMDSTLNVKPLFNQITDPEKIEAQTTAIRSMLNAVLRDSSGSPGSNLARITFKASTDVKDDEHYFNPEFFTLGEFKNVYSYLGGAVFQKMCEHILKVPNKTFFVLNPDNPLPLPDFQLMVKEIMPGVILFGKYTRDSEVIIERAHALEEANVRDTSVTAGDLVVPGSKEGFHIFPHQLKTHQFLRNHPRYAVLDVAPGGGKTITLLTDAADLVGRGLIKTPPCIFAPNGLVKNWVEDMHKVTAGRWNVIPITTATYRTWGDERLTKLIQNAPRNTIVVMSTSVLRLDKYPIVIGNHVETVSAVLEFARKFGFEYIALDESHRAKNVRTAVHKAVKQIMVSSVVKYIRIASGTLIKDKLTDVVGQAALFNAQIFRTAEEYEDENSEQLGDFPVMTWKKDTPKRAREQLSKHAAVITAKKKEWAFMLPRPIETFIPVRLEKSDAEGGTAHQLMYDAILKETLDEIRLDSDVMRLLQGHDEDEEDEDDDEAAPAAILDSDLDDATLSDLESKLEPYLARLEQLLTDPLGDPFGEIYFKGMSRDNYVSNKVLKIIERVKRNFTEYPWEKGKSYTLKDLCDYKDTRYVLMGVPGKTLTLEDYESEYVSHTSPDRDPRWKPEPMGKVIVFCRYTRSVNAIYRALPPELKKLAVKFTGEVKNKWEGFETFRKSPFSKDKGFQILVANEQSITEGHNMQMASRIVRCESPWAPGELDQSSSRIFRPDPSKQFSRENVYLDWVIANGCLVGSTLIPTEELGIVPIRHIGKDIDSPYGYGPIDLKVGSRYKNACAVEWRKLPVSEVFKVKTHHGYEVTGTAIHKMLTLKGDFSTDWSEIQDVSKNDYLVINPVKTLRKSKLDLLQMYATYGLVPQNPNKVIHYLRTPEVMTPELAFIMGFIDSEGTWHMSVGATYGLNNHKAPNGFTITNLNKAYIDRFIDCFSKVFGHTPKILTEKRKNSNRKTLYTVTVRSSYLGHLMTALGMKTVSPRGEKHTAHTKQVPDSILQADYKSQLSYLASYIEGDGFVVDNPAEQTYGITSYSPQMLKRLQVLLSAHGIVSSIVGKNIFIKFPYSVELGKLLDVYLIQKRMSTEKSCIRSRYDWGIPAEPFKDFIASRFLTRLNQKNSIYADDEGNEVEAPSGLNTYRGSSYFKYESYDKGMYDLFLDQLNLVSPSTVANFRNLMKLRYHYTAVDKVSCKGQTVVYDLSMEGEPAYVANGLVTHNTLEVAKMGRLISKMLVKTQFDEADNPRYDPVSELQLPLIRMSLETIASVPVISDIQEYIEAYSSLVHIQATEFEDMRQSGPSTMLDVPSTPMFKEAKVLEQVPYVPNLEIPDRHDLGLLRLNAYLQDTEDPDVQAILKDKQNLVGSYVHTEFGNGVITRVGLSRAPKGPGITPEEAEAVRRITRIDVRLASGDDYSTAPSMIFLATNVTRENMKDFSPTTKLAMKRDTTISAKAKRAEERQAARDAKKAERDALKAKKAAAKATKPAPKPKPAPAEVEEEENFNAELFPVVYNGFLALEATAEDPSFLDMGEYGFKQFGDYAYLLVKDHPSFTALLDFLHAKFSLSSLVSNRLEKLHDSFLTGRGRKFAVDLAPTSAFKNFYLLHHKVSGKDAKGRPELKIYPVILNQTLMLTVDLKTNPGIRRYLNKPIPKTRNLKFQEASGLHVKFFNTRAELIQSVKDMRADGIVVTNFADLKQELADLKTIQTQSL